MDTTGERIKKARLAAGMTQTELANKVGVKFSAIHKYENGLVVNLKQETIGALAKALNVRPTYLMCMDDDPVPNIDPERQALIDELMKCTDEELKAMLKFAEMLKGK